MGEEEGQDQAGAAEELRQRALEGLREERSEQGRAGLEQLLVEVLRVETEDPATWRRARGLASTAPGAAAAPQKASRKTLKALPTPGEVLGLYHAGRTPGLASAALHAAAASVAASVTPAKGSAGRAESCEVSELLADVLMDEDLGARCVVQRLLSVQAFLRCLPSMMQCKAAQLRGAGRDPLSASVQAVAGIEAAILTEMRSPATRGLNACFVALAALGAALTPQLSHKGPEYVRVLSEALASGTSNVALDPAALQVSLGLAAAALPLSEGELVLATARTLLASRPAYASRADQDWCLWGTWLALGALTRWTEQQFSTDMMALTLLATTAQALLLALNERLGSRGVAALLEGEGPQAVFSVAGMSRDGAALQPWEALRPTVPLEASGGSELGSLGACWGLSVLAHGLAHAGLDSQLLQLYHVCRAAAEAGVAGAELALASCAALGLRAGLLTSKDVFEALKLLGERIDSGDPSESALLGMANLVVGARSSIALPPGFVDDLRVRLMAMLKPGDAEPGRRTAAYMALYTMLAGGGPTFQLMRRSVGEGISMERSTAASVTALADTLRHDLATGSSQRTKNAAARILGLLVALRQASGPTPW
jgi:hypothetical protein